MIWFLNFGWTIVGFTHDLIIKCLIWKAKKILIFWVVQCTFPCSAPVWLNSWVSTVRYCNCVVVILICVPNFYNTAKCGPYCSILILSTKENFDSLSFTGPFTNGWKRQLKVVHHVWWMNFHGEEFSGLLLVVTESSKQGLKEDKDLKFYLNYLDYIFILIEM